MRQGISLVVVSTLIATAESFVASTTQRPKAKTTSLLASSTRRESFGEILGSALLPVTAASAAASSPEVANAADDYPFKVRSYLDSKLLADLESSTFIPRFAFLASDVLYS
jgi:hypothetical protein